MPLDKNFDNVVMQTDEAKCEISKLTELNKNDKNTIYNLIFSQTQEKEINS